MKPLPLIGTSSRCRWGVRRRSGSPRGWNRRRCEGFRAFSRNGSRCRGGFGGRNFGDSFGGRSSTLCRRRCRGFCGGGSTRVSRATWTTTSGYGGTARLGSYNNLLSFSCGLPASFKFGLRSGSLSCFSCCLWTRSRLFCTTFSTSRRFFWSSPFRGLSWIFRATTCCGKSSGCWKGGGCGR